MAATTDTTTTEDVTLLDRLQAVDPYEFEHLVADVWEERGWETSVSQASNDQGVDVVAEKSDGLMNQKAVIQAKRYSEGNKIGRPKIQQYHSLKQQDADADAAVVVTTSSFTSTAEDWASEHNVKLIDGRQLVQEIESGRLEHLVDEYSPAPEELVDERNKAESEEKATESGTQPTSPSDSDYFGLLSMTWIVQTIGFALMVDPSLIPAISETIATGATAISWIAIPILLFADAHDVHSSDAAYKPNRLVWPAVSLLFVIGPFLYLYKRMQN